MTLWQFLGPGRYDYRGPDRRWLIFASNLTWTFVIWPCLFWLYRCVS